MSRFGEAIWAKVGKQFERESTIKEFLESAGLFYTVEKRQASYPHEGELLQADDSYFLVREDTGENLSKQCVTKDYKIVQNEEFFPDFIDHLAGLDVTPDSAGVFNGGGNAWVSLKSPYSAQVADHDNLGSFIHLFADHRGKGSIRAQLFIVRLICTNGLTSRELQQGISIRHKGNTTAKLEEAKHLLAVAQGQFDTFVESAQAMAQKKLDKEEAREYFKSVLGISGEVEEASTRAQNNLATLEGLWVSGPGHDDSRVQGSLWTAYNAVTQWTDYYQTVRGETTDARKRFESVAIGNGAKVKAKAHDEAMALVEA
jgi:phage/plasmid-like protein (TIGR03299 family)